MNELWNDFAEWTGEMALPEKLLWVVWVLLIIIAIVTWNDSRFFKDEEDR